MKKKTFKNESYIIDEIDVLNFVTKSSTKKQREKYGIGNYYINGAVCSHCRDYIRSKHRHSFIMCSCGKTGVDGGSWYTRRIGNEEDRVEVIEKFYDCK